MLGGAGLLLIGLGLNTYLAWQWWGVNPGPLEVQSTFRLTLWGFLTMVLGVQTIFGSFFLSMLGMSDKARANQ